MTKFSLLTDHLLTDVNSVPVFFLQADEQKQYTQYPSQIRHIGLGYK